ncbi:component of SufBCD complex [Pararhodobacter sp.]|uniref:component of SufBCD complex n=1 Tax=Pararhodobacter sp. TaxID=2127056 RepID=UPI002AFF9E05|nr:component of SufBCD complex [Pararhodobacter sp.]
MDFYSTVFSTIDLRSFSNIWFWIAIAIGWSNMTHFIIGVPFDMVQRARRRGGQAMADLELMAHLQARRRMQIMSSAGVWLVGFWAAVLTGLGVLGFGYGAELAQAVTMLMVPMTIAALLGMGLAAKLARNPLTGKALTRKLVLHRVLIQAIGLLAILITTMYGTVYNLSIPLMDR